MAIKQNSLSILVFKFQFLLGRCCKDSFPMIPSLLNVSLFPINIIKRSSKKLRLFCVQLMRTSFNHFSCNNSTFSKLFERFKNIFLKKPYMKIDYPDIIITLKFTFYSKGWPVVVLVCVSFTLTL